MDEITNAINKLDKDLVDVMNKSGLHPSIIKLVLLNVATKVDKAIEELNQNGSVQTESNTSEGNS